MNIRKLGQTDLYLTPIGFGSWAIGGPGRQFALGIQDDQDSIAAIYEAIDAGINWIDTAPVYGLGHAEEVIGRTLRGVTDRPYVFTKCGMVWNDHGEISHSLKAKSIRRECEASLRRLGVETIDLYQIHWPNPDADFEEGWHALASLKEEGKVRHIGVSNFNVAQIKRAQAIAAVTSLQSGYSLLHREIEAGIMPFVSRQNIGVLAYSPMASGLLTGAMTRERIAALPDDDWRKHSPDFKEPDLSLNLNMASLLRGIGKRHGRTPGEVAVAWVLHNPAVAGAIVGARRPCQVRGVAEAAEFCLSAREIAVIDVIFAKLAA